ncbi:MAG: protein kinase [Lachnospiraceae bacterium]|nr:protein kinase [Lachnospiraceae bacterium]
MLTAGCIVGGRYRILDIIGQGGQSRVYLAHDERAGRQWAVKELRDDVENYALIRRSFLSELRFLRALHHPYLPAIVDCIDEGEGKPLLIVMDFIDGRPLSGILSKYGAQPQDRVVKWGIELCDVLYYLHEQKPPIIYRDLKPANIMLRPTGDITLIDFGTARQYRLSEETAPDDPGEDTICLGTRGYAAPEQFGGHGQTDARTDIYCLGATLYHLLTGHNPARPPYEIRPIRSWNPALSTGLEEIIRKCTMQDPSERFSSCMEVRYALLHYKERDRGFRRRAVCRIAAFAASTILSVTAGTLAFSKNAEARELNSWNELLTVTSMDPIAQDNAEAALENYCRIAIRIRDNTPELLAAGVKREDLQSALSYIAKRLETDIIGESADGEASPYLRSKRVRELSLELVRQLQAAEMSLNAERRNP